jgi:transcriptional regulator with XRE-family HTH domain
MPKKVHPVKTQLAMRGDTQRWLAAEVRVSPSTLSHILNGRLVAWPALRRRVAETLERSEDELFPVSS